MSAKHSSKGVALFGFVVGLIVLFVGVALMYLLPEYILKSLNDTGVFCGLYNASEPSQCLTWTVSTAQTKVDQIRGLGFVVIIIAVVWMLISIIGGAKKGE